MGAIGILLPFAPGLPFLLLAALCFATASPRLRQRLVRHPRMARLFTRIDQGARLDIISQARLTFWAVLEAVSPRR